MGAADSHALVAFLREAATYFESRDTRGEDSAFWSNVANAENCRKAAERLAQVDALDQERQGFANLNALLKAENKEMSQCFDFRWAASRRATKRWQAANPGNDLTWPDHADLIVWCLDQLAASEAESARARDGLKAARTVLRNAWGAVTSDQVVDKQVDKMLRRGIEAADAVLSSQNTRKSLSEDGQLVSSPGEQRVNDAATPAPPCEGRDFDECVLKAISSRPGLATYVIRNMLSWKSDTRGCGYWPGLETSKVLRACRRLQRRGLIEESPASYAVMKFWRPTPTPAEGGA